MRLRTFSLVIGVALSTVGLSATLALIVITDRLEATASLIQASVQSVYVAEELRASLLLFDRQQGAQPMAVRRLPQFEVAEAKESLLEIRKYVTTDAEERIVDDVEQAVLEYLRYTSGGNLADPGQQPHRVVVDQSLDRAVAALARLIEVNRNQAEELQRTAIAESQGANHIGLFLIVAILGITTGAIVAMVRAIYVPVAELQRLIERFESAPAAVPVRRLFISEFGKIRDTIREMSLTLARHRQLQLQFVAGVAHDIRNPLHAIQSALQLLGRDTAAGASGELLTVVSRQVAHLGALTRDLADTAAVEAGQLTLSLEESDLAEVVRSSTDLFLNSSGIHSFEVSVPSECKALCDSQRLTQVVNNLISNAVKYSPRGGRIFVVLKRQEGLAVLSVSDEGVGIAPEDLSRIFQPFRRTQLTERFFPGMGLGLSVSRRIVEAHGGTITVESIVGQGSTFRVELPVRATAHVESELLH